MDRVAELMDDDQRAAVAEMVRSGEGSLLAQAKVLMLLGQPTPEQAVALYEAQWWEDVDPRQIAELQLSCKLLCMDHGAYRDALARALGRGTWEIELRNPTRLLQELAARSS